VESDRSADVPWAGVAMTEADAVERSLTGEALSTARRMGGDDAGIGPENTSSCPGCPQPLLPSSLTYDGSEGIFGHLWAVGYQHGAARGRGRMGVVNTNDFRKKLKIMVDGQPWVILENDFVKPGKGQAFNRVKIKNLITGRVLDRTYKSGESIELADVNNHYMQYLYNDGDNYTFMNSKTFEQVNVNKDVIGDDSKWLLDNTECEISFWGERAISVTPPIFMEFTVTYTEPAVKGDTANNVTKKATLETGAEVNVPLFMGTGMRVKVDTRTGEYLERVK
jgi:elongation factor P